MARGPKKGTHVKMPEKTYWHLYSLQSLNAEKFAKVINKVLQREFQLIK